MHRRALEVGRARARTRTFLLDGALLLFDVLLYHQLLRLLLLPLLEAVGALALQVRVTERVVLVLQHTQLPVCTSTPAWHDHVRRCLGHVDNSIRYLQTHERHSFIAHRRGAPSVSRLH